MNSEIQTAQNPSEFAHLLQSGRILDALEYRTQVLEEIAQEQRDNCTAAKLISAGAIAVSLPFWVIPGVPIMAGFAGFMYARVVFQDWQNSKKICLIPGSRTDAADILMGVGLAAQNQQGKESSHMEEVLDFLPLNEAFEYKLLHGYEPQIADMLLKLPSQDRVSGYRYILRTASRNAQLPSFQDVKGAIAGIPASEAVPQSNILPPGQAIAPNDDGVDLNQVSLHDEVLPSVADPEPPAFLQPQAKVQGKSPINYLIGDRPRTSLIVAVSGGGKDYLLANAVRAFLARHSDYQVVVMDCKDDQKEYGYFSGLRNVAVHRLDFSSSSDGQIVQWVDDCLQHFINLPQKALLICNEGTLVRAKSKHYIDVVASLVSSGDSREKYVWEAGQSAHADELGINSSARSRFRPLVIGLKGEEMQVEAILRAQFVADSARNMNDVKLQMVKSPVGRAWSDGQAWYAMPQLENHCGYDRDSRSFIKALARQNEQALNEGTANTMTVTATAVEEKIEPVDRFLFPEQYDRQVWTHYQWWLGKNPACGMRKYIEVVWGKKPGRGQEPYREYLNFLTEQNEN